MTTITLWLLIHMGEAGGNGSSTTAVVERFATVQECERVRVAVLGAGTYRYPRLRCIQATVVRP